MTVANKRYSGEEIRRMMVTGQVPDGMTVFVDPNDLVLAPKPQAVKARARQRVPGQMNKTEARYADHLELQKIAGAVLDWRFEAFTLKLGPDLRYSPDFFVLLPDGFIEFHELKGSKTDKRTGKQTYWAEEDGLVKIRSAAQQFPWFAFRILWWDKDVDGWASRVYITICPM